MKMIHLFAYVILLLFVLTIGIPSLCAKAPTTPKILFTSTRDGNREIYTMNPDGSEQEQYNINKQVYHFHITYLLRVGK